MGGLERVLKWWLVVLATVSAGCFVVNPGPEAGDPCDESAEEPCGFGGRCDGGFCRLRCGEGSCDPGWVCMEAPDGGPYAYKYCYLPCSAEQACPETWGCADDDSGFCEYPAPLYDPNELVFTVSCPATGRVGTTVTCQSAIEEQDGPIVARQWSVSGLGGTGMSPGDAQISGADDAIAVEVELLSVGTVSVTLTITDATGETRESANILVD